MATIIEALRHAVGKLDAGEFAEVERIGRDVLRHDPHNADALHLLGLAARKQEQYAAAIDLFRQTVSLRPDKALYHFELAVSLRMDGAVEAALESYRQAVARDPGLYAAHVNMGAALDDLGRHAEAINCYYRALELKPGCPNTHANLGNSLQALGRLEESIDVYRHALELEPTAPATHWNFAMALLRAGHFREGWNEYEWRSVANETKLDLYPQPAWDGSSLAGKTLLVHAEQGIGDEILFASCYPDLIRQAAHCIFICEPRLRGLLARSFPQATVIGYRRQHERTPCEVERHVDFQIAAGSVPRFLRNNGRDFPSPVRYLLPDAARVQLWQERFAALGPGLKIGISWRAGGKPSEQVRRTTDLAQWKPLLDLPGVQFVNLQYGQTTEDLALLASWGYTVHDWDDADALTDLEGLAAMITALDLVISVGNTTVHLAGSLGLEAWSLVAANPSWRWMDTGDRVPWYSSVRLFRQERGMPWQSVFDRMHRELCQRIGIEEHEIQTSRPTETASRVDDGFEAQVALRIPANVSGMKFVARLTETVETAVEHHKAGKLSQAEALYREVLKNTPQHPDALHLLGVVCQQTGRTREALRLIRQAIALNDTIASFHFHLGLTQKDAGQAEEAIASFRRTLDLNATHFDAQQSLGIALQEQGRFAEAIDAYQAALAMGNAPAGLLVNLGAALRGMGRYEEARCSLEKAIELQPSLPEARVQLGLLCQDQKQWQEAMLEYQRAVAENPENAAAFRYLGRANLERQCHDEAIVCFQRALELKPHDFDSAANLGVAFEMQEQYLLAAEGYRQALAIQAHLSTHLRLIHALRHVGQLSEALRECEAVIAAHPDDAAAHCARAQIHLQQGDTSNGWREYSWRWKTSTQAAPHIDGIAHWDGSSLSGKRILIHGDSALNDTLMLTACLREVVFRAEHTTIACDAQLAPLLARTLPLAEVRVLGSFAANHDVQAALSELPLRLDYHATDFHRRQPLLADSTRCMQWREWAQRLGSGPHVGLMWRSRHKANVQPGTTRAPAIDLWGPLVQAPGARFIALLPEAMPEELDQISDGSLSITTLPPTNAIDELAAQLAALDLVIAIDDLSAHLAASLGKEVWLILPHAWGWQWPLDRETAPWYPTVRLFRPKRLNAWPALMARVKQEFDSWLAAVGSSQPSGHRQPNPPHAPALTPGRNKASMLTMESSRIRRSTP